MRCIWIRNDAEGKSYFTDLQVPMEDAPTTTDAGSAPGSRSDWFPATSISFRDSAGGAVLDFHPAPRRQMAVVLKGALELECSRGTKRRLEAGDALFADDLEGQGHITRFLDGAPLRYLMIQAPKAFDPASWPKAPAR